MKRKIFYCLVVIGYVFSSWQVSAQTDTLTLDLNDVVYRANRESLASFRAKNMYLADYWEYRSFKANRLPALSLDLTPIRYNRNFTKRYDSQENIDIYRKQQSLLSSGNLSLKQNFDWLGGTFFVDSELGYYRNFGDNSYTQYSSIPFRIGYMQQLLGYNPFKWEKKIAPLKYEAAQKELLYNIEQTAEEATTYFFRLAMAQAQYELAIYNLESSNKMLEIGEERFKIAGIRQSDLYTLKLDKINAQNSLQNAKIQIQRSMFALATYLGMDKNTPISLKLPNKPKVFTIKIDDAVTIAKNNNPQYVKSRQRILELEREMAVAKMKRYFNASLSASVGFNQVAENFTDAYKSPLQQDIFAVTLSIPLLDWGVRKGDYNVAKSNLAVAELSAEQEALKIEEDIIMTVGDFSIQQELIQSAEEALKLAKMAYEQTQERFIIGKVDMSSMTLANNRHQEAQRNYIAALQNYWLSYYKIRRLTLYDFEKDEPIGVAFDEIEG